MRALDRRRLMAIVNGMIMRMSEWLGEVAKKGEEGLMNAEKRLDKAEVKLRLIETKVSDDHPVIHENLLKNLFCSYKEYR